MATPQKCSVAVFSYSAGVAVGLAVGVVVGLAVGLVVGLDCAVDINTRAGSMVSNMGS